MESMLVISDFFFYVKAVDKTDERGKKTQATTSTMTDVKLPCQDTVFHICHLLSVITGFRFHLSN